MSLHADALATLRAWEAPSPAQATLRERYVGHLAARDDAVWRSCFPDHLTAGTLVVSHDLDHVLLNLHRKARRWFAFGGHCEPGDLTLVDAARREAIEESGLAGFELDPEPAQLDVHPVDFCDPRGTVHHLDVRFVALAPPDAVPAASEESLDVRWWPVTGLPDLEPAMHRLVEVARARFADGPRGRGRSTGSASPS